MNTQLRLHRSFPCGLLLFALWQVVLDTTASAQGVGVNFVGSAGAAGALASGDLAGLPGVAQSYWNNVDGAFGSLSNLVDSAGHRTSLAITWRDVSGTLDNGAAGTGSDFVLMRGALAPAPPGLGFSLFSIPYPVYDLIVYMSGPAISSGDGVAYSFPPYPSQMLAQGSSSAVLYSPNFTGSFVEATSSQAGNYYRFHGLNYGSVDVTASSYPIAAMQVVGVPGPATVPILLQATLSSGRGGAKFSLDGTQLAYNVAVTYPWGVNPRLELHGPAPIGADGPLVTNLPSVVCDGVESMHCGPVTGTLGLTPTQARQLADGLWYLLVLPQSSRLPPERCQIVNLLNPTPTLQPVLSSTELSLRWPVASRGFVLEATSALGAGGEWQAVTNPVDIVDQSYSVSVGLPSASRFFRLHGNGE